MLSFSRQVRRQTIAGYKSYQAQVGTFANDARSKRTPTRAKIIFSRGIKSFEDRSVQRSYSSMPYFGEMVRKDACNGHLTRNPFNFQLSDLQGVRLTLNGEEMPYSALEQAAKRSMDITPCFLAAEK